LLLLEGVDTVGSGYIAGHTENPTYAQISTGNTGHAEAVKVTYDTTKITFDELLEVFFTMHDPTQLNRQGNDVGTRSEEHTSELQSRENLVCRLLLEKKK